MTENNEENETGMFATSKFWRTFLVIIAAVLIFAGPTYFVFVLVQIVKLEYFASVAAGFVVLLVGIAVMYFAIRKKVIM